jgi:hypothetical protein
MHFQYARGDVMRLQQTAEAFLRLKPTSFGGLVFCAFSHLALGEPGSVEAAESYLSRARSSGNASLLAAARFDPAFHATLPESAALAVAELPPVRQWKAMPETCRRFLFCACDGRYFDEYGRTLARSFARNADADTMLVFHLFDVSDAEAQAIAAELARILGEAFALSTETTGLQRPTRSQPACDYYHAVRFIRFHQMFIAHPEAAAWQIDADMLLTGSITPLFTLLARNDVGLVFQSPRLEPYQKVSACLVGVAPTPAGRDYITRVAGYIAALKREGKLVWRVDQAAMYAVYAARGNPLQVGAVTTDIYSGTFSDHSAVWPGKVGPRTGSERRLKAALAALESG